MYEELINTLRKMRDVSTGLSALLPKSGGDVVANLYGEAADAIEELSREIDIDNAAITAMDAAMPRWIPVKEPPKEGEPVFVHIPCRYRKQESIPMIAFWEQGQWKEYESHRLVYNITHWMPLPQPPEEEK